MRWFSRVPVPIRNMKATHMVKQLLARPLALAVGASFALIAGSAGASANCTTAGPFAGSYIGASLGGASLRSKVTSGDPADPQIKDDDAGVSVGFLSGYAVQCDNIVLGFESDTNYVGLETGKTGDWAAGPITHPITVTDKIDFYSTLRGRVGVLLSSSMMAYVTGGLAYAQVKHTLSDPVFPFSQTDKDWRFGWTLGGGLEVALRDKWTLRGEAMFVDLGDKSHNYTVNAGCLGVCTATAKWDDSFWVARVGLTYQFDLFGREEYKPLK